MTDQSTLSFLNIIIPVYNKVQYLNRYFDSLIISAFSDFEIIIVNDGSTDNTTKSVLQKEN